MSNTNTCKTCRYFTPGHPMLANPTGTCGHHSTPITVKDFLDPIGSGILIPTEITVEDRSTSPDSTCPHHEDLFLTKKIMDRFFSLMMADRSGWRVKWEGDPPVANCSIHSRPAFHSDCTGCLFAKEEMLSLYGRVLTRLEPINNPNPNP